MPTSKQGDQHNKDMRNDKSKTPPDRNMPGADKSAGSTSKSGGDNRQHTGSGKSAPQR